MILKEVFGVWTVFYQCKTGRKGESGDEYLFSNKEVENILNI
jgi:hypothetical protein